MVLSRFLSSLDSLLEYYASVSQFATQAYILLFLEIWHRLQHLIFGNLAQLSILCLIINVLIYSIMNKWKADLKILFVLQKGKPNAANSSTAQYGNFQMFGKAWYPYQSSCHLHMCYLNILYYHKLIFSTVINTFLNSPATHMLYKGDVSHSGGSDFQISVQLAWIFKVILRQYLMLFQRAIHCTLPKYCPYKNLLMPRTFLYYYITQHLDTTSVPRTFPPSCSL